MHADEELIHTIENPASSTKEREAAAADLVERCRKEAGLRERYLLRFVTFLADDAPAIRGWGILGVLLCDETLEHLPRIVRLLEDPSPGVRLQAVHALGPLGIEEAQEHLASRLSDDDRMVRIAAAATLAVSGDPRATPVLIAGTSSRMTRFESLTGLRHLARKDEAGREAIEKAARNVFSRFLSSRFERLEAAGVLAALGDPSGKDYVLERARKGKMDRPMAIELLGNLRIEGGEALLREFAGTRDDPFRGAALRGLGSYGAEGAFDACRTALQDETEDADVRCDAAEGLLLLGSDEAKGELLTAMESARDEKVKRVVSVCLSLFGKPLEELRLYLPLSGEEVVS